MSYEMSFPLYWYVKNDTLRNRHYLNDLDFIREHTDTDFVTISSIKGIDFASYKQCHDAVKELTLRAHELGIKVSLKLASPDNGYFNDDAYTIDTPYEAQAMCYDYEVTADENGFATLTSAAKWILRVFRPLRNEIIKIFAFDKTESGFYEPESLRDVTSCAQIIFQDTKSITIDIHGGKENAGKTYFVLVAQYYNDYDMYTDAKKKQLFRIMDVYKDVPLDSVTMDEFGFMDPDFNNCTFDTDPDFINVMPFSVEPFRGRNYSKGMDAYFREKLNLDLTQLLFDMRYAPKGKPEIRIKAINIYFDEIRKPPIQMEYDVAEYADKLFGPEVPMACHNTWHQNLDAEEVYKTGFKWWNLPRYYGFTDGSITFPVRMGVMLSAKAPKIFDMHYSREHEFYYRHISAGLPFGGRLFHHSYNDGYWGADYKDIEFLKNIKIMNRYVKMADDFAKDTYPQLDLLVLFGCSAQTNWYPDNISRNDWDLNGSLKILDKCESLWNNGYRCALVSDDAVNDGRVICKDGAVYFNGYKFTHTLFLYPRYAKKKVFDFINSAAASGANIAVAGKADMDFDAEPVKVAAPCFDKFSFDILEKIGCPKTAVDGGGILTDGSFILCDWQGMLKGKTTDFDFTVGDTQYTGKHTGFLAYRKGEEPYFSEGSILFENGKKIL